MASYRIGENAPEGRFSDEMTFGAMNKVVKRSQIEEALSECGIQANRVRMKLPGTAPFRRDGINWAARCCSACLRQCVGQWRPCEQRVRFFMGCD